MSQNRSAPPDLLQNLRAAPNRTVGFLIPEIAPNRNVEFSNCQSRTELYRRINHRTPPGTSAMCMGGQRRPWRTSCSNAGGTEPLEQESEVPLGKSVADVLPAHDAETINSSKTQHRLGKLTTEIIVRGTSLSWTSSQGRDPSEKHRRLSRREGDARLGQCPAMESIGVRGYLFPKGGACRLS